MLTTLEGAVHDLVMLRQSGRYDDLTSDLLVAETAIRRVLVGLWGAAPAPSPTTLRTAKASLRVARPTDRVTP